MVISTSIPDPDKIVEAIKQLLKLAFGDDAPSWLPKVIGYALLIVLLLLLLWGFLWLIARITELWRQSIWPLFCKLEERRRSRRRRRFADHVEREIRRLNSLEDWRDYRFADLEAEVEAEGKRRARWLPFWHSHESGLRREQSLSNALRRSQERLILLEGEPGSGKSVALRHVGALLALKAMRSRSSRSLIPLYVNLRQMEVAPGTTVDSSFIRNFVLQYINRANDRDLEEFLETEFDRGIQEGTWLFLFDSFDEIPEVLSSTETDPVVQKYSSAISDFVQGMNQCRAVLASREFRGPRQLGWCRFRIVPLSGRTRHQLIKRADLPPQIWRSLMDNLAIAGGGLRLMASNPMFLGLLCEYMRLGNPFPRNPHALFEQYVNDRLTRDEFRLLHRFQLQPSEVRASAEKVAFCMMAGDGMGLTPRRDSLREAMATMQLDPPDALDRHLHALEYLKLARSDLGGPTYEPRRFTFSHRRFQEYFATCLALRESQRVDARDLVCDARWRETAVVMCQTQPEEVLSEFMAQARSLLVQAARSTLVEDPIAFVNEHESDHADSEAPAPQALPSPFPWPSTALHVMHLLQEGFAGRTQNIAQEMRLSVGQIALSGFEFGTLSDKKWALESAGAAPEPVLRYLCRAAFKIGSPWLRQVAYRQVARLAEMPSDIRRWIHIALTDMALTGALARQLSATRAHLSRLHRPSEFLCALRALAWAPAVDGLLHLAFLMALLSAFPTAPPVPRALSVALLAGGVVLSYGVLWWLWQWHARRVPSFRSSLIYATVGRLGVLYLCLRYTIGIIILGNTPLLLAGIGCLTWAPLTLAYVRIAKSPHPAAWPLLHALPLLWLARHPLEQVRAAWKWLLPRRRDIALTILVGTLCSVIPVGILVLVIWMFPEGSLVPRILRIVGAVAFIAFMLHTVLRIIMRLSIEAREVLLVRRLRRAGPDSLTAAAFLRLFDRFRTAQGLITFLRTARQQQLLETSPDVEETLQILALAAECAIRGGGHESCLSNFLSQEEKRLAPDKEPGEAWLRRNFPWLAKLGYEALDEVSRLYENARDRPPQPGS